MIQNAGLGYHLPSACKKLVKMETASIESTKIKRVNIGVIADAEDQLAREEPLEIQVAYESATGFIKKNIAVTMRTPGNDGELAIGFLFTEGIIKNKDEIKSISQPDENIVLVALNEKAHSNAPTIARNFYTTSSCGICGKASIDAIRIFSEYHSVNDTITVSANVFYELPLLQRKRQEIFGNTGGLHAAALFDLNGNFLALREDIGRHNALDKLIGHAFMNKNLPMADVILLLSGRAGFELIQKALMAGIKIIAAIGAPSSLAVELAKESNMTLIGFLKNEGFNIYSGDKRIVCD